MRWWRGSSVVQPTRLAIVPTCTVLVIFIAAGVKRRAYLAWAVLPCVCLHWERLLCSYACAIAITVIPRVFAVLTGKAVALLLGGTGNGQQARGCLASLHGVGGYVGQLRRRSNSAPIPN